MLIEESVSSHAATHRETSLEFNMFNKISAVMASTLFSVVLMTTCYSIVLLIVGLCLTWLFWPDILRLFRHIVRYTAIAAVAFTLCNGDRHTPRHNEVTSAIIAFN